MSSPQTPLILQSGSATDPAIQFAQNPGVGVYLSSGAVNITAGGGSSVLAVGSSGITVTGGIVQSGVKRIFSTGAKIGTTAGWAVNAADNLGVLATCPASQTASTLVVPISGLQVGSTITSFHLIGQIESGGGIATIDADLRVLTAVAADITDASVGAITQLSVTADAIMSVANTNKASLAQVVSAIESYYVLITVTTAAATDIALQGVAVTVTGA